MIWQPIDSAPKDGTVFIAWLREAHPESNMHHVFCKWAKGWYDPQTGEHGAWFQPLFWMPLADRPERRGAMPIGTCDGCGESGKHLINELCDSCTEARLGLDAAIARMEYDPIASCPEQKHALDANVAALFKRAGGTIDDPIECALAELREYCSSLEDAIRFRDAAHGAPPPWRLR